ncbi:MAG: lipopolysaccharide heptosyltransferase II [Betaproteobacteria bacterium]|nr:lipopolysaccharide heptosyltransferase II [Betaproteobacteria bacterium]
MQRILVVGPSWVGDAVLAQPLLKLLHARHAGPALDVLAPPWTLPLFERMPEVRRAIASPFIHGDLKLSERRRLGRELAREGYDQAIVLPNTFKSALVPFFAGIPRRTGYVGELRWGLLNDARRLDPARLPRMAERFAALAHPPGAAPPLPLPVPALRANEAARRATLMKLGLESPRPVIVLCPGAEYGPAKRWPAAYFARLARELAAEGWEAWLVGSPNDAAIGAEIEGASGGACRNLCGATTLGEAMDVLASARLVVSNDSGLMHVAAALGKPVIALYGSSSPAFTPPLSPAAFILKLDLPCSPCFRRVCPLGHFNCMMQLTPERVSAAVRSARIA